jgi:hypothetical protein
MPLKRLGSGNTKSNTGCREQPKFARNSCASGQCPSHCYARNVKRFCQENWIKLWPISLMLTPGHHAGLLPPARLPPRRAPAPTARRFWRAPVSYTAVRRSFRIVGEIRSIIRELEAQQRPIPAQ